MTDIHVPSGNISGMVFSLLVAWGLPLALMLYVHRKKHADFLPFFLGCGSFFVFAMLLEQLFHLVMARLPFGPALFQNVWLGALYGGLTAGVFEETGRYVTMRFFMKKTLSRENALMYGVGHGGMEAIIILGITSISNLMIAFLMNTGELAASLAEGSDAQAVMESLRPLAELPAWQFFLGGGERIMAIALQIALSLLVYRAVKEKDHWILFPAAILLHALVDAVVYIVSRHGFLWLAEFLTLAGTLVICYAAWNWGWKHKNAEIKEK